MGFEKWGYSFEGAYTDCSLLEALSGVYLIWCNYTGDWTVLDIGEADNIREKVCNHERRHEWLKHCPGSVYFSAKYMPDSLPEERRKVERDIRKQANPPLG